MASDETLAEKVASRTLQGIEKRYFPYPMSELDQLLSTLKRQLKARGMTYRDLAGELDLSEASVKRLFASGSFTLERLLQIANLLGFTLAELSQEAAASGQRLHTLSEAQERELVSDDRLLLVAVCVLNQWRLADILSVYRLSESEAIRCLARLDRLRLIELLPGNRVRLNVARDFDWRPDGPIQRFFLRQGLGEFLASDFAGADQALGFAHGMLTEAALAGSKFIGGSLKARATRIDFGRRNTSAVGPYCSSSPASITAV